MDFGFGNTVTSSASVKKQSSKNADAGIKTGIGLESGSPDVPLST